MLKNKLSELKYLEYFESIAKFRIQDRKSHSYYWNDITNYISYFSHPKFRVLEIGCGTGELLNEIPGENKIGIDFSSSMISIAKTKFSHIEFFVMEAESIELTEKFDLIILSNLIGYANDVQKIFEQLQKVCHPHTKIIVNYFNNFWEPILKLTEIIGLKRKTPQQNWLTMVDIKNLFMLAGFGVYKESRRVLIPFYIPLISALANKFISKLPLIRYFCLDNYSFATLNNNRGNNTLNSEYSTSIIIPARNESGNIENAVLRIPKFCNNIEIIFIEGNSTDDTWEKIKYVYEKYKHNINIKIAQQTGKGKNDAVKMGFEIATGDVLMILDADLTVQPEDLPKFYDAIKSGKGDFINGCRLVYPMEKEAMRFLNMLGNKFFSIAFSWLLEQPFKDTLCGTKVLFREDYKKLDYNRKYFGDFDPFGDYDLIFGAYKLNLKIVEMPIRYKERTYGTTNISRFKHGIILLRMCMFAAKKIKFK